MRENRILRYMHDVFHGKVYQGLAIIFCLLFGLAMIANIQMGGEAEWFWYANLFHSGTKLYADLHLALQPLFVLETNASMQLFGTNLVLSQVPSVIHVLALCFAIFLILQESDWPNWQKAILLAGAFLICVECSAYRFDDFHVLTEIFIFYSLVLLLMLAKADTASRQLGLATALGALSGLTITTRLTDGAALLVAVGVCLLFLTRGKKLAVAGLFVFTAALVWVFVVKLTGDSLSDYASNSIIRAADAKGGTHNILAAPFLIIIHAFEMFSGRRWLFPWIIAIVVAGALIQHYWKKGIHYIVPMQLAIAAVAVAISSPSHRELVRTGVFVSFVFLFLLIANYLLLPLVVTRYLRSKMGDRKRKWDSREILVLIPLAELASVSVSTGAQATTVFLAPIAMLLLLVPVIQPFRRQARWANASFVTIMVLLGTSTVVEKIQTPYLWLLYRSNPMFVDRQWYHHPVHGSMYMERDLLQFIEPVCQEITQGNSKPELLSMSYSYPNYFCDTPPWHGYVQTFFDTSTRSTISHLMTELDTSPPQWIVYQRQMRIMGLQELYLHHGQRVAHRDLDEMIMRKIVSGQWQVVSRSDYLFVDRGSYQDGDGWWIIRTRP
jgi:hypothetical protein